MNKSVQKYEERLECGMLWTLDFFDPKLKTESELKMGRLFNASYFFPLSFVDSYGLKLSTNVLCHYYYCTSFQFHAEY